MALNRTQIRTLVCGMSTETRKRNAALLGLSWECSRRVTQILWPSCMCTTNRAGDTSIDSEVTNKLLTSRRIHKYRIRGINYTPDSASREPQTQATS